MKFNKALLEYYGVDPARVPDFEEFWALYATSFYERLFGKMDDPERMQKIYTAYMNNPKLDKRDKAALTFFYNLRLDELEDPDYWDKVGMGTYDELNKNESKKPMKAKLVNESLKEYNYGESFRDEALERAKEKAKRISRKEGVSQHVNEIRPGVYKVEDWYDSDSTVVSFYNGLEESLNESNASQEDFNRLATELEKRRIPCKVVLKEFAGRQELEVHCGWDYPDRLFDKVYDAAEAVGVRPEIMADSSGGTIIASKRIAGGPKNYSRGGRW